MGAPTTRLWLAVFSGYTALGATVQALPAYVVDRFHGGPMLAGTAVGIAFLATACVRPFAGRLGDAGLSRQVAAVGAALCAVGGVGHLVAPDPVTLLFARLVMGAGEAALFSGSLPASWRARPRTGGAARPAGSACRCGAASPSARSWRWRWRTACGGAWSHSAWRRWPWS
ncbi:hypothetical protein GCM10029964_022030 [Kibdelosporangium lantanae]